MTKLSQFFEVTSVSLYIPEVVLLMPLKNLEPPWHSVSKIFVEAVGFTVKFKVIKLSHPFALMSVSRKVPVIVLVMPLKNTELP